MTTTENSIDEPGRIAGFWRRLFALVLDSVVLGSFGLCLGSFLYDYLVGIGAWGRVIGFAIALAYFGAMNSCVSCGQTIGKMAMKVRAVSASGTPLSVASSFFRSFILCVPFFLNGAPIDAQLLHSWLLWVLGILVFGVGLSIAYLFLFNRKTRQSLHDLAVGSYVVRVGGEPVALPAPGIWRGHLAVVVALVALAAGMPIFTGRLAETEPFVSILSLQKAIANEPGIRNARVQVGASFYSSPDKGSTSSNYLSTSAIIDSWDVDREALADRIAQITLVTYEPANQKNFITLSLSHGYDIGIASAWKSQNFSYSPAEWRERLALKPSRAVQETLRNKAVQRP